MIYFLRHVETGLIKIGKTKGLTYRLSQLKAKYGDVEILGLIEGYNEKEAELHKMFAETNHRDKLSGREWFVASPELLKYIAENASSELPEKDQSLIARIPVSTPVLEMLKDVANGAGLTYDELLRFIADEHGAEIDNPHHNVMLGFSMRTKLAEWKSTHPTQKSA